MRRRGPWGNVSARPRRARASRGPLRRYGDGPGPFGSPARWRDLGQCPDSRRVTIAQRSDSRAARDAASCPMRHAYACVCIMTHRCHRATQVRKRTCLTLRQCHRAVRAGARRRRFDFVGCVASTAHAAERRATGSARPQTTAYRKGAAGSPWRQVHHRRRRRLHCSCRLRSEARSGCAELRVFAVAVLCRN